MKSLLKPLLSLLFACSFFYASAQKKPRFKAKVVYKSFTQDNKYVVPQNSFRDSLVLKVGNETIVAQSFGEGHTRDTIGLFKTEMFSEQLFKKN